VPPRVPFIAALFTAEFRRGLATLELLTCAFLAQGQAFACLVAENWQPPLPHRTAMAAPLPRRRACARDRPRPPLAPPDLRAFTPKPRQSFAHPCIEPQPRGATAIASPPRCRRAHAAMSRSQRGEFDHPHRQTRTHTGTCDAPDLRGATLDPGDADKWDQGVSRSGKRRKKRKGREGKTGRDRPSKPKNEKGPGGLSAQRRAFSFSFFTTLTRGSHLSVRPAG